MVRVTMPARAQAAPGCAAETTAKVAPVKPFAESCEQNKHAILEVLQCYLPSRQRVLEIGSGTGQHAVFFAAQFPHLHWQTSDRAENHPGIRAWLDEADLPNVGAPLALDVEYPDWPSLVVDAVFSANTAHIMAWPAVVAMFAHVGRVLGAGGVFCLYGPFNYAGDYSAGSNRRFDAWLRQQDPAQGVRDFEALDELAADNAMGLVQDHAMPADNRILVWQKRA